MVEWWWKGGGGSLSLKKAVHNFGRNLASSTGGQSFLNKNLSRSQSNSQNQMGNSSGSIKNHPVTFKPEPEIPAIVESSLASSQVQYKKSLTSMSKGLDAVKWSDRHLINGQTSFNKKEGASSVRSSSNI